MNPDCTACEDDKCQCLVDEMLEVQRWNYRSTLNPHAVRLSPRMNRIAAEKAYGPLLLGPASIEDQQR